MRRNFDPSDPFYRISQAVKEMKSLHEFYDSAFQIGGFGPWEQLACDLLYLSAPRHEILLRRGRCNPPTFVLP